MLSNEKFISKAPAAKVEAEKEKLEKYNLANTTVEPQNPTTTKKFTKQHLMTDTGIELKIPMEEYNNKDRIEFITNSDGTICNRAWKRMAFSIYFGKIWRSGIRTDLLILSCNFRTADHGYGICSRTCKSEKYCNFL